MRIEPFKVEQWMNEYEVGARYNIAETCVDSVSMEELARLTGTDLATFWHEFSAKRLTYGDIEGRLGLREGICKLYRTIRPQEIVTTHGAAGANHHVFYSLVEPGDRVISIMPTYQQLYSIPESFGADVQLLHLTKENGYLPDLEELRKLATPDTKVICINNPNNPTGALMSRELLEQIVEIARNVDAWVMCDEVYRHLTQEDAWSDSIVDLYPEKGVAVGSMSKVFSLAGLRLGWIVTHNRQLLDSCVSHRDYDLISCGMFDEAVAEIALHNSAALLQRNRGIVRENLAILDAWVQGEKHVSSYELCKRMYHETGAFVTPGDCFEQPHSMRIGYACDRQTLRDGLAAISAFMKTLEEEMH